MKLGMLTGGNVLIMHIILFRSRMKIMVALVTEIVKIVVAPVGNTYVEDNTCAC